MCIALCTAVLKSGIAILSLEWECPDLEWNILHGERGTADWLVVAVRALILVSEIGAAVIQMS